MLCHSHINTRPGCRRLIPVSACDGSRGPSGSAWPRPWRRLLQGCAGKRWTVPSLHSLPWGPPGWRQAGSSSPTALGQGRTGGVAPRGRKGPDEELGGNRGSGAGSDSHTRLGDLASWAATVPTPRRVPGSRAAGGGSAWGLPRPYPWNLPGVGVTAKPVIPDGGARGPRSTLPGATLEYWATGGARGHVAPALDAGLGPARIWSPCLRLQGVTVGVCAPRDGWEPVAGSSTPSLSHASAAVQVGAVDTSLCLLLEG